MNDVPDQTQEILPPLPSEEVEKAFRKFSKLERTLPFKAMMTALCGLPFLLAMIVVVFFAGAIDGITLMIALAILGVTGLMIALVTRNTVKTQRELKAMGAEFVPRIACEQMDWLCRFYETAQREPSLLVRQALLKQLPQIGERGYLMSRHSRQRLFRTVGEPDATLAIIFLRMLEDIGDSNDLPLLQQLAHLSPTRNGILGTIILQKNLPQIKEQARLTLDSVTSRISREAQRDMLLRPSESNLSEALLRPATETPDPAPQTLLRASIATEETPPCA
ncbi:MAG: hypothetical protein H7308_00740 [Chthonomonadaceae bacterium]|nr:hypothetical protein [Chthonomonadaceae bacterium]